MSCFCHEATATLLAGFGLDAAAAASLAIGAGLGAGAEAQLRLGASAGAAVGASATLGLAADPLALLVAEAAAWLAARWLPAPAPWQPDPAWLELDLPAPPMPPAALSVVLGLVQARLDCVAGLGLDPLEPGSVTGLARLVATLNARLPALAVLAADARPWSALASLNAQADLVLQAGASGLFGASVALPSAGIGLPAVAPPSLAPWRPLIARVKALAPLLALARMLGLDLAAPGFAATLSAQLRVLARVSLPPLADPALVLSAVAQLSAVARLTASFGADPRGRPFAQVQAAVARKLALAAAVLPAPFLPPPVPPNPSALVNAEVLALLARLTPGALAPLNWTAPPWGGLPLLTVAAPAAALVAQAGLLGTATVRATPCGRTCDAAAASRALAGASATAAATAGAARATGAAANATLGATMGAGTPHGTASAAATASPGSGRRAAPAG